MSRGNRGSIFILSLVVCFVLQCSNAQASTSQHRDNNWYGTDTGWVLHGDDWYYVGANNVMLTNTYIDGYYLSYTGRMINESASERSVNKFIQALQAYDTPKFEIEVDGRSFVDAAGGKNIYGPLTTLTENGLTYGWYDVNLYDKMRADLQYMCAVLEPTVVQMLNKSEQDIISQAHDTVCALLEYGSETNASDSLRSGQGACGSYAVIFKYLLNACGIDCDYVTGYTSEGLHAWNRVHTSDGTFLVDVCWDDISLSRDWYMKEVLPNHIEVNK